MKQFMEMAIEEAKQGICNKHGGPFGAVIVQHNEVIAIAHNTVLLDKSPVRHAEINAIELACKKLGTPFLDNCSIFTTTEPCPMCMSAILWARIPEVYYGTAIEDVKELGFNEIPLKASKLVEISKRKVRVAAVGIYECFRLLKEYAKLTDNQTY